MYGSFHFQVSSDFFIAKMTSSFVPTHSKGLIPEIPSNSLKSFSSDFFSYNSTPKISKVSSFVKKGLKIA